MDYSSTFTALAHSNSTIFSESKDSSKRKLLDQMREKAKASTFSKHDPVFTKSLEAVKPVLNPYSHQTSVLPSTNKHHSAKKMTPSTAKSQPSDILSPLDTYELSDREASDSDSDSEDGSQKPKKRVPVWAQRANLIPALDHQYARTGSRTDPDIIFGEVQTCDLQAIFDQKKARYQRRTSSGNWNQDRASAAEKLTYKRNMGYNAAKA
jgi:hypothetical protein